MNAPFEITQSFWELWVLEMAEAATRFCRGWIKKKFSMEKVTKDLTGLEI